MANLVVPNEGAIHLLNFTLGRVLVGSSTQKVGLYLNNITPVPGSVYADFVIATGSGMDPQTITPGTWSSPTIVSDRASSFYGSPTPFSFTNGGSTVTAYGYLVFDSSGPTVLWAQVFDAPRVLNPGDILNEQLNLTGGTAS